MNLFSFNTFTYCWKNLFIDAEARQKMLDAGRDLLSELCHILQSTSQLEGRVETEEEKANLQSELGFVLVL